MSKNPQDNNSMSPLPRQRGLDQRTINALAPGLLFSLEQTEIPPGIGGFGARLRVARLRLRRSQRSVKWHMRSLGFLTSEATVSLWESGRQWPRADELVALAEFLEVDSQWLLIGQECVSQGAA